MLLTVALLLVSVAVITADMPGVPGMNQAYQIYIRYVSDILNIRHCMSHFKSEE